MKGDIDDPIDLRNPENLWIHLKTNRVDPKDGIRKEVKLAITIDDREGDINMWLWRDGDPIAKMAVPLHTS